MTGIDLYSSSIHFDAGVATTMVTINPLNDLYKEGTETLTLNLGNQSATISAIRSVPKKSMKLL